MTAPAIPLSVEATVGVPWAPVAAGPNAPPGSNEPGRVVAGSTVVWWVPMPLPVPPADWFGDSRIVGGALALESDRTPGVGVAVVPVELVVVSPDVELVVAVQELPPVPTHPPVASLRAGDTRTAVEEVP